MKNKKIVLYIIAAVCLVAVIVATVLLCTRARYRYELNESGDGYVITDFNGWAKKVKLPSKRRGLPVVSVGQEAFAGNDKITAVTIPASVERIEYRAFADCVNLNTVKLSEGLKDIYTGSFGGCTSITEIVIPDSVTAIRGAAFQNCTSLTTVKLPKSLETINYLVFLGCGELKNLSMNEGGEHFYVKDNCLIDKEIGTLVIGTNSSVIPTDGTVSAIGDGAFYDRIHLASLFIPESVKSIGESAFYGCRSLYKVEMKGVNTIGVRAFFGCTRIDSITISSALRNIDEVAFYSCSGLESISFYGSEEEFERISVAIQNEPFTKAQVNYK